MDDEPLAREILRGMCERSGRVAVIASAASGHEALASIDAHPPDLIFLDIGMPGMDGVALARHIHRASRATQIVFATAYDHYAAAAFDMDVTDYLLKPLHPGRLSRALTRVETRLLSTREKVQDELWLPDRGSMTRVSVSRISHVTAESDYVRIHAESRSFLLRETLAEMERRLGREFVRVHRSTMIRWASIEKVHRHTGGRFLVTTKEGLTFRVGRSFRTALDGNTWPGYSLCR